MREEEQQVQRPLSSTVPHVSDYTAGRLGWLETGGCTAVVVNSSVVRKSLSV